MSTDDTTQIADEAVETLRDALHNGEVTPSTVNAAKALLQRFSPKKTDEEQNNEAAERDAALTEARGLLAEFAALKLAYLRLTARNG